MDDERFPKIVSFVIRFVLEQPGSEDGYTYRVFVRHVQTDEELAFTNWEAAQQFMGKFVQLTVPNTFKKGEYYDASQG